MAMLLFVGHCNELGWSFSRLSKCLAGLAFGFKSRGWQDFTKGFLVKQALKGWHRVDSAKDNRKPVSFALLKDVGRVLNIVCHSEVEVSLFKAAFSLAFFGAFRLGELVSGSKLVPGGLRFEDVDLFADRVDIVLRKSKTDQLGKGRVVRLYAVEGCVMCPVLCVRQFLRDRHTSFGPLFIHKDGSFLSRFQFLAVFKKCLCVLGKDVSGFSGHSFRIGAATEAARRGLGDEIIKRIGRWESRRFRSYVRMDMDVVRNRA
ncbi:integrase/recombinase xerD homolog [Leptodactylus fuscus]